MIKPFDDRKTRRLFADEVVKEFEGFGRGAKRKLEALHATARLEDLRVPPSNRPEKLKGDLKERNSIPFESTTNGELSVGGLMAMPTRSKSSIITDGGTMKSE